MKSVVKKQYVQYVKRFLSTSTQRRYLVNTFKGVNFVMIYLLGCVKKRGGFGLGGVCLGCCLEGFVAAFAIVVVDVVFGSAVAAVDDVVNVSCCCGCVIVCGVRGWLLLWFELFVALCC